MTIEIPNWMLWIIGGGFGIGIIIFAIIGIALWWQFRNGLPF